MTRRKLAAIILLACLAGPFARTSIAASYAGVFLGIATATGLSAHRDTEADRVSTGPIGTTIILEGLFPLKGRFSFSPSFSFLTTNGDVEGDPAAPNDYDIRFQQSELALDLLWKPGGMQKFRMGPGVSIAWWSAAEDRDRRPYYYSVEEFPTRVSRSQSPMFRGVACWMLRNPEVSGISVKLIGALPMTDILKIENSAATGYVALHIGFSMLLN